MAFGVTVCVVVQSTVLELSVLHLPYQRLPDYRPHNRHDRASGSFYYPNRRRVDIPYCHNYNYWYMYCLPSSPQALSKNKNQKVTTGNWIQTAVRQFVLAIRRGFPNKAYCLFANAVLLFVYIYAAVYLSVVSRSVPEYFTHMKTSPLEGTLSCHTFSAPETSVFAVLSEIQDLPQYSRLL